MNWKGAILGLVAALILRFILEWVGVGDWLNGWICSVLFMGIYQEIY